MGSRTAHPVDRLSDQQLRELMLRVDTAGFPADLAHLWKVEGQRYRQTLRRIPSAESRGATLLDLGSSRPWVPFYRVLLGYHHVVLNTSYPQSGFVLDRQPIQDIDTSDVRISVFDIERDAFPHDDASFDVVCCLEVIEHLAIDPMAMMAEVNRVLKPGGLFVLTTPNAVRYSNIVNALLGDHPSGWSAYNGFDTNRHNREYTPSEIERLLAAAGLAPHEVLTFGAKNRGPARDLLGCFLAATAWPIRRCPPRWRNDLIIATGHKVSTVVDRRPSWLYFDMAERVNLTTTTPNRAAIATFKEMSPRNHDGGVHSADVGLPPHGLRLRTGQRFSIGGVTDFRFQD